MDETVFKARIITGLSQVSPDAWNRLANPPALPYDPFLSWEFLEALESSGAARPETGKNNCRYPEVLIVVNQT